MKAVVFEDFGRVAVADVPEPGPPGPHDAVLRTTCTAICGSDLHILHGRIPGMTRGSVIGHECIGVVAEVGDEVTRFKPGDRAVASFQIGCGRCWFCRRTIYNHCEDQRVLGYGMLFGDLPGAQAEAVAVPDADLNLLKVNEALTDEQALFSGDQLTSAFFGAHEGRIEPGDTVVILGAGPVGILAAQSARLFGPEQVVVTDLLADRLELAKGLGFDTVDASGRNSVTAVAEMTGGRGADVVIDAAGGHSKTLVQAMNIARRGGRIVVLGVHSELEMTFPLAETWLRGLTLVFSGTANIQAHWERVLGLVGEGKLDPAAVISHRMKLADGVKAYELFDKREATKVVLTP